MYKFTLNSSLCCYKLHGKGVNAKWVSRFCGENAQTLMNARSFEEFVEVMFIAQIQLAAILVVVGTATRQLSSLIGSCIETSPTVLTSMSVPILTSARKTPFVKTLRETILASVTPVFKAIFVRISMSAL